jgi:hypothetical protein
MAYKIDAFKAWERARTVDLEKMVCQGTVSVSIRMANVAVLSMEVVPIMQLL